MLNLLTQLKSLLRSFWSNVKGKPVLQAIIAVVIAFLVGLAIGWHHKVPERIVEKTVEDTVTKQKLTDALQQLEYYQAAIKDDQRTITDLQEKVKTHTRITIKPDGTKTIDKTTETDTTKKTDDQKEHVDNSTNTKKTDETKTSETDTTTHKETEKTIEPLSKDWLFDFNATTTIDLTKPLDLGFDISVKHRVFKLFDADVYCGPGLAKEDKFIFKLGCAFTF